MRKFPVDLGQFLKNVEVECHAALQFLHENQSRLPYALEVLLSLKGQEEMISDRVKLITERDSGERCASPFRDAIVSTITAESISTNPIIIASDGSQIFPERDAKILFALTTASGVVKGDSPTLREVRDGGRLMMGKNLIVNNRLINEQEIGLIRDVGEREYLEREGRAIRAVLAPTKGNPSIVGLFDGPIELFHQGSSTSHEEWFQKYLKTLCRIADEKIVLGGYVDSPLAGPVIRMIEFMLMKEHEFSSARNHHPLFGLHDVDLFDALLNPGERSAVFELISSSARFYQGEIGVYFFYLKVGESRNSSVARVEIPRYVAEHNDLINLLHHSINEDIKGSIPYPYCLIRAHEVAVISKEAREDLERIIVSSLMKKGFVMNMASSKSKAKKLLG